MFFSINTFYVLAAFNKNANQLQISAKGGILFIIVIVYHVTKPRGNRVKLPLPWTWFSFYPHTYVHKCTCGHYCGILGINEPYSSCTGSSIAKCGRVNQYFNKFWWISKFVMSFSPSPKNIAPLELCYPQLPYICSYAILNWVQKKFE
jgi:hypothetical protein